jgi:hypothetical protein
MKILMQFDLTISQHAGWNFSNCLIGPHILPPQVTGCSYINFLQTHLSGLLEDVSFNILICGFNVTMLHHISHEVYQWLSKNYHGLWTGYGQEAPDS